MRCGFAMKVSIAVDYRIISGRASHEPTEPQDMRTTSLASRVTLIYSPNEATGYHPCRTNNRRLRTLFSWSLSDTSLRLADWLRVSALSRRCRFCLEHCL